MKNLLAKIIASTLILIMIAFLSQSASAYTSTIEMQPQESMKTLYWGEKVTYRNYTIEAKDFTTSGEIKSVMLNLYKDGVYVAQNLMTADYPSNHWNYNNEDEIWIDVSSITIEPPKNAYVNFFVTLRGLPSLAIEVTTDYNSYKADRDIQLIVKIKNNGYARTGDVKLNIDTSGLRVISGETIKSYLEIQKNEQVADLKLTLDAPSYMEKKTITINATCTGYDAKNLYYTWTGTKSIDIESMIEISKLVAGGAGYLSSGQMVPEIYMDETVGVSVVAMNHGDFTVKNIILNDSVLADFKLKSGETNWKVDIAPGEQQSNLYIMIPLKPGSYTLPKALANWTYNGLSYSIESTSPTLVVHGPYIELTKTADKSIAKQGDTINVTVTARNSGDRTCSLNLTDETPNGAKFLSGNLTIPTSIVIKSGESTSIAYKIEKQTNQSLILPPAMSTYVDIKNYRGISKSNIITITNPISSQQGETEKPIGLPTNTPTPTPASTDRRIAPGFETFNLIIGIAIAILYLMKRRNR